MEIEKQYLGLLEDILQNGIKKGDRTGTGTISLFGRQLRHKMSQGFPLLTTKKMYFKGIVTELIWFLRGDTNIKYLLDNDCHIWDGDAYKKFYTEASKIKEAYLEGSLIGIQPEIEIMFSDSDSLSILSKSEFIDKIKNDEQFGSKWGELGPIYGKQWRKWFSGDWWMNGSRPITIEKYTDQIVNLINDLKNNPDSRRLLVSAWNVGEIDLMTLPPCHYGFQVYTRELSLKERINYYETNFGRLHFIPPSEILLDEMNVPKRSISLMWSQRSCDVPLGIPFNLASYALLLIILGKLVNMIPEDLIANLGDCHIYTNQIEGIKEQLLRDPYELPKLNISNSLNFKQNLDDFLKNCHPQDFEIGDYKFHPSIKIPLSN